MFRYFVQVKINRTSTWQNYGGEVYRKGLVFDDPKDAETHYREHLAKLRKTWPAETFRVVRRPVNSIETMKW